jgi:hypothetical protein
MNDFLPFKTLLANPLITLRRAGLLTLYALLLGLFIPGFLQYNFNTFFPEDIVEKLPPTVKEKVMEFDDTSNALKNSLTTLDRRIALGASAGDPKELSELLGTRRNLETYIKIRKPPFHIAGFYPDPLTLLWPLFYVSFFWLNFLLAPTLKYKRSFGSYVLMFLGLLFFYQWPTWIR